MGMFDTLYLRCPKCKEMTEYQSKIHDCCLNRYVIEDAPLLIIADANDEGKRGKLICDHCDAKLRVIVQAAISVVTEEQAQHFKEY